MYTKTCLDSFGFFTSFSSHIQNIWRPIYCPTIALSLVYYAALLFSLRCKLFTHVFYAKERTNEQNWFLERKCVFNWLYPTNRIEIVSNVTSPMSQCLRNTFFPLKMVAPLIRWCWHKYHWRLRLKMTWYGTWHMTMTSFIEMFRPIV